MTSDEANNTRIGGIRQDPFEFKNEFSLQIDLLKSSTD